MFNKDSELLEKTIYYYNMEKSPLYKINFHKENHDSIVFYYKNGNVFKNGKKNKKGNTFGKWNYYTKEGFLSKTHEYFIINDDIDKGVRLNQVWYFNKERDTMFYGNSKFNIYDQEEFKAESKGEKTSIFVRFRYANRKDTISIAEPLQGLAEDAAPFWESRNSNSYIVLGKEKHNFNKDFSNLKEVKLDTFVCLKNDKVNNPSSFPDYNPKYGIAFGRWFDTPGKKILRGYMVEHYKRKATPDDSIVSRQRRTYFEKVIYVKDTIKAKIKN